MGLVVCPPPLDDPHRQVSERQFAKALWDGHTSRVLRNRHLDDAAFPPEFRKAVFQSQTIFCRFGSS